jgi:hypothetical protein
MILAVSACVKDARVGAPPVDGMITLKVEIPREYDDAFLTSRTRANAGTPEESRINNLRFFVFKSNRDSLELYADVAIASDGTSTNPAWDASSHSLRVVVSPGPKRVYCVANWAETPTVEMPELTAATIRDTMSLVGKMRVNRGISPVNPPVMSGRLSITLVGNESTIVIPLARQVARVGLTGTLSKTAGLLDALVEIMGVKFARLPGESLLFAGRTLMILPGPSWDEATFASSSVGMALRAGMIVTYPMFFYVPENTTTVEKNATVMIIKALYNKTQTFYAVTLNQTPPAGQRPFTMSRNYYYNYILTINGRGADTEPVITPGSRAGDGPAFTNIRCERVEAW